jgi:hypothetical protein
LEKGKIMTRQPPMDDWIAYAIVFGVVAATILGKILIARGDKTKKDESSK